MGAVARVRLVLYGARGPVALEAGVARTPAERARGFAGRTALGPGEALLFAFPADTRAAFTLARTGVALDVLFLDASGRAVAAFRSVPAWWPAPFAPAAPYRYALETPAGWLAARGVGAGAVAAWTTPSFTPPA